MIPGKQMKIVAPFGFYGWGNVGDESTLQGFAQLVRRAANPPSVWIASRNTAHTARVEPSFHYFSAECPGLRTRLARKWAHQRAAATVFPGGTPIMDGLGTWPLDEVAPLIRAARAAGRPVAFVGAGTEHLQRPESRAIIADVLAPNVEHWTVRSEQDRERLTTWGVPGERVTVAADLAWLLPAQPSDFGRETLRSLGLDSSQPFVGVNVNNEAVVLKREPKFFEKLGEFLDRLVERHDARVLFFCSEVREGPSFDKAASQKVLATMRRADRAAMLPNRYWTPQELLSLISCCRMVVSMRYHVCLFSALQQVPFIAVQRSDKVRDLCTDIGWPFGLPLDGMDAATLLELADGIEQEYLPLSNRLGDAAAARARASARNHVALEVLSERVRSRRSRRWIQ